MFAIKRSEKLSKKSVEDCEYSKVSKVAEEDSCTEELDAATSLPSDNSQIGMSSKQLKKHKRKSSTDSVESAAASTVSFDTWAFNISDSRTAARKANA